MRHELRSRYLASTPAGCDAVISALGHNLTLRGMYGAPRKLCTDTVSQLCRVAEMLQPARPIRLIAISTEGVDRPDGADPPRGRAERLVTSSNPDPDPDPDPDRNPDPDPNPDPITLTLTLRCCGCCGCSCRRTRTTWASSTISTNRRARALTSSSAPCGRAT